LGNVVHLDADAATDQELLDRHLGGDREAFDVLARRHEDRVFSLALRMLGDRSDALDATQDTLLAVYRRAASFRGEAAFTTWLYRVCVNSCRDLMRKRARLPIPAETILSEEAPSGPAVDDSVALRIDVVAALAALPDEYREAVALHDLGGLPYDEIAAVAGVPIGTVKSRISRGRKRLAELLEHPEASETSK
jgi:RNA polymerase sigma-70 factor (ECF subfamily)